MHEKIYKRKKMFEKMWYFCQATIHSSKNEQTAFNSMKWSERKTERHEKEFILFPFRIFFSLTSLWMLNWMHTLTHSDYRLVNISSYSFCFWMHFILNGGWVIAVSLSVHVWNFVKFEIVHSQLILMWIWSWIFHSAVKIHLILLECIMN